MIEKRVCRICETEKDITDFLKIKGKRQGRCKSCRTAYNLEKKVYRDEWYGRNRDRLAVIHREYVQEHREKIKAYKTQWYLANKELSNQRSRAHYEKTDKDFLKNRELQKHYGISLEEKNTLLESQGGCCAICGAKDDITGKDLSIDHCHETMIVRGILCSLCNTGIGMLGDNSIYLQKALTYLLNAEKQIRDKVEKSQQNFITEKESVNAA